MHYCQMTVGRLAEVAIVASLAAMMCLASAAAQAQDAPGAGIEPPPGATSPPSTSSPEAPTAASPPPDAAPSSPLSPAASEATSDADADSGSPVGQASLPSIDKSQLPKDLSPWGMYQAADIVVKSVLIGLIIASIVTWTIWLAKTIELAVAKRRMRVGLRLVANSTSLADAARALDGSRSVLAGQIEAATSELRLSGSLHQPAGLKERLLARLQRIEAGAGRGMTRGTGVLATIGATAPFVGLFGTVWGIMNSFIGISKAQTTNLAVVAPGIAEALLATALGLAAAIPAVIIYNHFTRSIAGYKSLVADASSFVMRLVSLDLDRGISQFSIARAAE